MIFLFFEAFSEMTFALWYLAFAVTKKGNLQK